MYCKVKKVWREDSKAKDLHISCRLGKEWSPNVRQEACSSMFLSWFFQYISRFSTREKNNMKESLSYPLNPATLSLSQVDGNVPNSSKSKLVKQLESLADVNPPFRCYCYYYWCNVFLVLHSNVPNTFNGVARYFLANLRVI